MNNLLALKGKEDLIRPKAYKCQHDKKGGDYSTG